MAALDGLSGLFQLSDSMKGCFILVRTGRKLAVIYLGAFALQLLQYIVVPCLKNSGDASESFQSFFFFFFLNSKE